MNVVFESSQNRTMKLNVVMEIVIVFNVAVVIIYCVYFKMLVLS